jgi:hypothetical protein
MTTRQQAVKYFCYSASELLKLWTPGTSAKHIGELLGVNRTVISRWRNNPTNFNIWQADKYAVRLGLHPSEIWTDWYDKQ